MDTHFFYAFPAPSESVMERDRYMSPMEAQDFGIIDRVLVHPPQAGQDEPELVQKEPAAAASPSPQPETQAPEQASPGTNPPSSYKPEPWNPHHSCLDLIPDSSWEQGWASMVGFICLKWLLFFPLINTLQSLRTQASCAVSRKCFNFVSSKSNTVLVLSNYFEMLMPMVYNKVTTEK